MPMPLDSSFEDPLVDAKGIIPRFYKKKRTLSVVTERDAKTGDAVKREPQEVEDDYVELTIAGDRLSKPTMKVTDRIKATFPDYWRAYQAGLGGGAIGTPLSGHFEQHTIEKLAVLGIRTMETLAELSSHAVDQIPGGRALVHQAQRIVNGQAAAQEAAKSQALESQVQSLSAQLAQMQETLQSLAGQETKRGRKSDAA